MFVLVMIVDGLLFQHLMALLIYSQFQVMEVWAWYVDVWWNYTVCYNNIVTHTVHVCDYTCSYSYIYISVVITISKVPFTKAFWVLVN